MGSARYTPGFRWFSRKIKVIFDGFWDYALVFDTKVLDYASPKLDQESMNDPNLIGSNESL